MTRKTKQALLLALALLLLLTFVKHLGSLVPFGKDIGFIAVFLFQIFIPIWVIERGGEKLSDYKIGFLDFKSIHWPDIWQDVKKALFLSAIVFVPYLVVFHVWYLNFPAAIPPDPNFSWLNFIATQFLIVALSEEIFYRGFLQTRLLAAWPNKLFFLGVPLGIAIIFTNSIFALGHFVGEYNFLRLAPFFPGLLFSYLAFRSNSIVGAIVFHALCNIFGQFLHVSYFWK